MSDLTPTNATAVSRALRKAGFLPIPPQRRTEGLRVSNGLRLGGLTSVLVDADWDHNRRADRNSADAEQVLVEAGYRITRSTPSQFYVKGREATTNHKHQGAPE